MSTGLETTKPGAITLSDKMPEFLRSRTEAKGTDELTQYIRPPFVKIVQGSSEKALKEAYPEKSTVLVPGHDLVAPPGEKILFTPILFYTEYLLVNPLELKGQMKMVEARSFDRSSEIARRALNPDLRNEQLFNPDGSPMLINKKPIFRSYQDTRVFLVIIHAPVAPERVCAMTFARGELRTADRLSTLISARQKDIFSGVYEAIVGIHKNPQHDWYGFDIDNPTDVSPFIMDEKQFLQYENMHDLLSKALAEKRLILDPVEGGGDAAAATVVGDPDGVVDKEAAF